MAIHDNSFFKHRTENTGKDIFDDNEILEQEQDFIDYYMRSEDTGKTKLIINLYRHYIGEIICFCFFWILKTSPTWVIPIITANVIDIVAKGGPNVIYDVLIRIGIILIFVIQNPITTLLSTRYLSIANRKVEATLRGALIKKLQQLSLNFRINMEAGRIHSKIIRDVERVENLATNVSTTILGFIVNMLITVSVVLYKCPPMLLLLALTAGCSVFLQHIFRKSIRKRNKEFRLQMENTSSDVLNMVHLLPVTRAHALENIEVEKMTDSMKKIARKGHRVSLINSTFGGATWTVFTVFQIICLCVSCIAAYKNQISIGDITLYQSYFSTIISSVSSIIMLMPQITTGLESVNSIGEILCATDIEKNNGKKKLKTVSGDISFENVYFAYDERKPVLNGLDLSVKAGETIALVGESGAGKSTIVNMIVGFMFADSGKVTVDGYPINRINLHEYRKHLAVVPQTSILFSGTLRENITYGLPDVSEETLNKAINDAMLTEFINSLPDGLETTVGEEGDKLSGGQRQRISIARAILRNPDIIIFDEATSALDTVTEKYIQEAIENLTKDRTTFIVAHRLSTIQNADKIAVIKAGKCTEFGTFDELMALKGEFYHMKKLQS